MSGNGNQEAVGILWVNRYLRDLLCIAQAKVCPRNATVRRLVNAVAERQIGAMQALAACDINDTWIRRRNFDCANGAARLLIKDGLPGSPEVGRPPGTTIYRANIEDIGLTWNAGDGARSATAKRSDISPLHRAEELGVDLLRVCWKNAANSKEQEKGGSSHRICLHQRVNLEVAFAGSWFCIAKV